MTATLGQGASVVVNQDSETHIVYAGASLDIATDGAALLALNEVASFKVTPGTTASAVPTLYAE